MVKEYNPGTKRAFKTMKTSCDFIDNSDPRMGISIKTPTLHDFIDTLKYEIIISSDIVDSNNEYGFLNTQKEYDVEVILKYPTN